MSLDEIDILEVLLMMAGFSISIDSQLGTLASTWTEDKEIILKEVFDGQPYINKIATATKFWDSVLHLTTAQPVVLGQVIDWEVADPVIVLEAMSQGVVSAVDIRGSSLDGCRLQDFANSYLHEYLNCSPWMDEWRLIAQRLFRDATWEDLAALHIDQIVKYIWQWQFPLGAFGKWLDRVLGMLKEDLSQAGFVFEEATSSDSYKQSRSGLGMVWMWTDECSAL